jgi:hypothetical protein
MMMMMMMMRTAEVVGNSGSARAGLTNCDNNVLVLI